MFPPERNPLVDDIRNLKQMHRPDPAFKRRLKGNLLMKYETTPRFSFWQLASSAATIAVMIFAVALVWLNIPNPDTDLIAGDNLISPTRPPKVDPTPVPDATYTKLLVTIPNPNGQLIPLDVEIWRAKTGAFERWLISHDGEILHEVKSGGAVQWHTLHGDSESDIWQPITNVAIMDTPYNASLPLPNFGWNGMIERFLYNTIPCEDANCVLEQVYIPPLGIELPQDFSTSVAASVSYLESVKHADGKTIAEIQFDYNDTPTDLDEPSSQHRILFMNEDSFEVLSIADMDGEMLLRSWEKVVQEPFPLTELEAMIAKEEIAGIPVRPITGEAPVVVFGDILGVTLFDLTTEGGTSQLHLTWQLLQPMLIDYVAFVHVVDNAGNLIAQLDTQLPTYTWAVGDKTTAIYELGNLAEYERYQLVVGVYHPLTSERLPVEASIFTTGDDNTLIIDVFD